MYEGTNEQDTFNEEVFWEGFEEAMQTTLPEESDEEPENVVEMPGKEEADSSQYTTVAESDNSFLTVRYNGKEVTLGKEEAIIAAQKGLNYDKLESRLAKSNTAQEEQQLIESLAQARGLTKQQMLQIMQQQTMQRQTNTAYPVEHAQVFRQAGIVADGRVQHLETEVMMRRLQDAEKQKYLDFVTEYPAVTKLPQEVTDLMKQGATPLNAYRTYENAKLKNALAMQEKNRQNLQAHVGSAQNEAEDEETDPFVIGFDSV